MNGLQPQVSDVMSTHRSLLHEQAHRSDVGDTLVLAAVQGLVEVMRKWRPPEMPIHAVMAGLRQPRDVPSPSSPRRSRPASTRPASQNA